jgi:hypothetical protein
MNSDAAEICTERSLHARTQITGQGLAAATRLLNSMLDAGLYARRFTLTATLDGSFFLVFVICFFLPLNQRCDGRHEWFGLNRFLLIFFFRMLALDLRDGWPRRLHDARRDAVGFTFVMVACRADDKLCLDGQGLRLSRSPRQHSLHGVVADSSL